MFNVRDQDVGLVEKIAGYLRVEECVRTSIEQATTSGGKADFDSEVVGWTATANGFQVETKEGDYTTERLIVCGGAWKSLNAFAGNSTCLL